MRLLIIENDVELLESLRKTIESSNYELDYTNDAFLGLSYALSNKYDAILINLHINKVTIKEFVSNLYAHQIYSPIIALTTKEILSKQLLNHDIVLSEYLALPFYTDELLDTIKLVLELKNIKEVLEYNDIKLNNYYIETSENVRISTKEYFILSKLIKNEKVLQNDLLIYAYNYEYLWIYIDSLNYKLKQAKSKLKILFDEGGYKIEWLKI